MKVLIVDDEKLARERLRDLLLEIGGHAVVGEAANGSQAVEKAVTLRPDVLLLDIRMPVMDGLEAAMHLMGLENPPAVIFTTAYDEHALEAFGVNAIDYLLKPIRVERLEQALKKVRRPTLEQLQDVSRKREDHTPRSHISVHLRGAVTLVPIGDIIYFQADSKYLTVRTKDAKHLIEESLVRLEEEFGEMFLRVHRNALVAKAHVRGLEKQENGYWKIVFNNVDDALDVSRRHTATVRKWIRR